MRKNNNIAFTGYYGMSNFGDDLFGLVCASGAAKFWPQSKTRVLSTNIDGVDSDFTVPSWFNRDVYASAGLVGTASRLMFALREASRSQTFILGGGSVLSSQSSGVRDFIYKTSKFTKLRFAALGVSIGPFSSGNEEKKAKEFLSGFEFISVRDSASYRLTQDFALDTPIVMAGDLAGLMPILFDTKVECVNKHTKPTLGVSMCNYESIIGGDEKVEQERNRALTDAMIKVVKRFDARVEVFSLNNHPQFGDDLLAQYICSRLSEERIEFNLNRHIELGVCEIWKRISYCDTFIGVRLHSAIAAYLNKVPFFLVEYHKKCEDFLDDIGQSSNLRLSATVTDPDKIEEVLERLFLVALPPSLSVRNYCERARGHFSHAPWMLNVGKG